MTDTTTEPTFEEKVLFLKLWAADNKCVFEDDGQVGVFRECVGILKGNGYVDYEWNEGETFSPPESVSDAYHKHDCLAVLFYDYEDEPENDRERARKAAIEQLYLWVKKLEGNNVVVQTETRQNDNVIEALLHGTTRSFLVVKS